MQIENSLTSIKCKKYFSSDLLLLQVLSRYNVQQYRGIVVLDQLKIVTNGV